MSESPHCIRLRGPWSAEPLAQLAGSDTREVLRQRVNMPLVVPTSWGDSFHGRVRFTRGFHAPTGIGAGDRLLLVVEGAGAETTVRLDEGDLGTLKTDQQIAEFDVTNQLSARHQLAIDVDVPLARVQAGEALIAEVRLEIHTADDG